MKNSFATESLIEVENTQAGGGQGGMFSKGKLLVSFAFSNVQKLLGLIWVFLKIFELLLINIL
jgi:hypothetical protein